MNARLPKIIKFIKIIKIIKIYSSNIKKIMFWEI